MCFAEERVAAIKMETDKLTNLLDSQTKLTREDKELTEKVARPRGKSTAS